MSVPINQHCRLSDRPFHGRLSAVAAVGGAAANLLSGKRPQNEDSVEGLAYAYLTDARRGLDGFSELDAVLLGAGIGREMMNNPKDLAVNVAGFTSALLKGDAADAFSYLPEYNALNAWDMLTDIAPSLQSP